ncbi:MAG: AgmX/PglI C-terminal domain-containing protein [Deltaproteobacteria bacterium]|nr:AgmX/PglI C-terminal domain-containing protein [Deltaproteobacteria bacterium]
MKVGHIVSIVGALLYLAGALFLPWQRFDLAGVDATSIEAHSLGLVFAGLAALVVASSVWGLVTGHRGTAARINFIVALLLLGWVVVAGAAKTWSYHLMAYEEVGMDIGYVLGIWGMVLVGGGAALVFASMPKWDETTSFLRLHVASQDSVVQDIVVYEPRVVHVRDELKPQVRTLLGDVSMRLPSFQVTREGDCSVHLPDTGSRLTLNAQDRSASELMAHAHRGPQGMRFADLKHGDRGSVSLGEAAVAFEFVRPLPGRSTVPLTYWTEVTAFTMVAVLFFAGVMLYSILGWTVEAVREIPAGETRTTTVTAELAEDKKEEKIVEVVEADIPEPEVSKKAGGEEGKFGDPDIAPQIESKIPKMDGKMVDKIDAKNIGLNEILNSKTGVNAAIADVLNGDVSAMNAKLAVAMGGEGSELVVGFGSNGMGFTGDGDGGGGDGVGRIHGMGDIDTGGGPGVKAGIGDKGKKRVGKMDLGSSQASGFCKKSNIESVVRRRAGAIRACYEQRLQVKKELKGKLTVRWTINTEGGVDAASASADTVGDGETTNCVMRHIRRMRFDKPEGGICVVQWPFVFSPG